MTDFKPGDRVVYKFSGEGPGDTRHDGFTGTVERVFPANIAGYGDFTTIKWDNPGMMGWQIQPYTKNLQLVDAAKEAEHALLGLASVTPITTEYEADSHFDPVPFNGAVVAHPAHYTAGREFEPKDVIRDWSLNFNLGSAVKYISRAGRKDDELQDLRKARQFLDFEIEALEAEAN